MRRRTGDIDPTPPDPFTPVARYGKDIGSMFSGSGKTRDRVRANNGPYSRRGSVMAHNSEINQFIQENSSLFWWIKPEEKMDISINALVEAVLNYGNEKSVKKLFDLIGLQTVANIFHRQISGKRPNYHQRTKHFFQLYFKKHA